MRTIYNNDLSLKDHEDYLRVYKDYLIDIEDYKEEDTKDIDTNDNDFITFLHDTLELFMQDTLDNLDYELKNNIIVIADLGLWDRRVKTAYKWIGSNLKNILYSDCDYIKIYIKNNNIRSTQIHHDGTNYLLFRELKDNKYRDILENKLYNGSITSKDISRYTKSLVPYIKEIYG